MRLVVQRVSEASVSIQEKVWSSIDQGLLVFIGIHKDDKPEETDWFVNKLIHLRIFSDKQGKMNLSLLDSQAQVLVVSQFTLYGNCLSGRRPDFIQAAPPSIALPIYEKFISQLQMHIAGVKTGEFGAEMKVALINDGPVTFIIEKEKG
jgi:D-aminoacyl-tRNA deacylase